MNREEEIEKRASEYAQYDAFANCDIDDVWRGFVEGAKYTDEHPSSSVIVKVWNLAMEAAIAQLNREMPYFKSEKEIKDFINKKLKL